MSLAPGTAPPLQVDGDDQLPFETLLLVGVTPKSGMCPPGPWRPWACTLECMELSPTKASARSSTKYHRLDERRLAENTGK